MKVECLTYLMQQPQYHFFTVSARQGGNAKRDILSVKRSAELPVLRQPAFGNIQIT
jgi:hypothetical protein